MNEAQIYAELTTVFHDIFDDESIILRPDLSAADIKDWDSVMHVNLIVATESRFGVRFKTAELEMLRNVGEFVKLIDQKLSVKAAR